MSKPVVCIPCNRIEFQKAPTHAVKNQYVRPLLEIVDCIPVLIPAIGENFDLKSIAHWIDGILLTGSTSNVCPTRYGAKREFEEHDLDISRDETTLPLIQSAIEMDIPLFAICRGFQEMNVALGGTLHQFVQKIPGKKDHRADYTLPMDEWYLPDKHKIHSQKGGVFERLGLPTEFFVNSIHQQGIDRLGTGLFVEGIAEDGIIEAISVPGKRFIFGAQWHPEGDFWVNPPDKILFEEFGRALRKNKK